MVLVLLSELIKIMGYVKAPTKFVEGRQRAA